MLNQFIFQNYRIFQNETLLDFFPAPISEKQVKGNWLFCCFRIQTAAAAGAGENERAVLVHKSAQSPKSFQDRGLPTAIWPIQSDHGEEGFLIPRSGQKRAFVFIDGGREKIKKRFILKNTVILKNKLIQNSSNPPKT